MRILLTVSILFTLVLLQTGCPSSNPSQPGPGPTPTPTLCTGRVGKTTASNNGTTGDRFGAFLFTVPSPVTLVQLAMPLSEVDPGAQMQLAVYADATGSPSTLIAASGVQGIVEGVNVLDIPDTVLPAGNFWLAYLWDAGVGGGGTPTTDGAVRVELDVSGGNVEKYYNCCPPAPGSLPDPFGAATDSPLAYVAYGIYCP